MSTYTTSLGLELITPGSQAGLWGNTTNNTFTLVDQAITGVTPISFATASGSTYTLTDYNGAVDEARSAVLNVTGTAVGANTIVIPNKQKTYFVRNSTGQDIVVKTPTGVTTTTVGAGYNLPVFCDGNNAVFPAILAPGAGTLTVTGGGTGATTFNAGGFVKSSGGTNALTASTTVDAATEMSGVLPVTNGGTGLATMTAGAVLLGNGTGNIAPLTGSSIGQVLTWNGSNWAAAAATTAPVTSVNGLTGAVSLSYSNVGAPSISGTNATGTWPISISGSASVASNVTNASTITMTANSAPRMTINSSGLVGIATTNPLRRLHVVGPSGTLPSTPVIGARDVVIVENNDVNCNMNLLTGGTGEYKATVSGGSGPFASLSMVYNSGTPYMQSIVNGGEVFRATSAGHLLVVGSTDQGAYNLQCNGTGVWGFGAYVNGSDAKLKENVADLDSCIDVVMAMRPVTYQYKKEFTEDQSVQTGFIAQDLQAALAGKPYLDGLVKDDANHLNVAYQNIIPILTKAIQELKAEVEALKAAK